MLYKCNDGFLYYKAKASETTINLRCQLHCSIKCPATASIDVIRQHLTIKKPHCHDQNDHELLLMNLKNDLKDTAAKSSRSNREIFDEVCRNYDPLIASKVSFPHVERGMSKRKAGNYRPISTTHGSHSKMVLNFFFLFFKHV